MFWYLYVIIAAVHADKHDPPALDYLGAGYDMIFGNPDGSEGANGVVDPGFRIHIVQYDWNSTNHCTGLPDWKCPSTVSILPEQSCHYQSTSTEISTTKQFQSTLSKDCSHEASVSGEGYGVSGSASFSASQGMNEMSNKISNQGLSSFECKAICVVYTAELHRGIDSLDVGITEYFERAVHELPDTYTPCFTGDKPMCPKRKNYGNSEALLPHFKKRRSRKSRKKKRKAKYTKKIRTKRIRNKIRKQLEKKLKNDLKNEITKKIKKKYMEKLKKLKDEGIQAPKIPKEAEAGTVTGNKSEETGSKNITEASEKLNAIPARVILNRKLLSAGKKKSKAKKSSKKKSKAKKTGITKWLSKSKALKKLKKTAKKAKKNPNDCKCDESVVRYFEFIKIFGTHVTSSVDMGGKMIRRVEIKSSDVASMKSSGIDVAFGAAAEVGYSGFGVSASGSYSYNEAKSSSQESKESVSERTQKIVELTIGGTPNDDWKVWASTARKHPMPVRYKLLPLYDFVRLVDKKKAKLFHQALKDYTKAYAVKVTTEKSKVVLVKKVKVKVTYYKPKGKCRMKTMAPTFALRVGDKGDMKPISERAHKVSKKESSDSMTFSVSVPKQHRLSFDLFKGKIPVSLKYVKRTGKAKNKDNYKERGCKSKDLKVDYKVYAYLTDGTKKLLDDPVYGVKLGKGAFINLNNGF